MRIKSMYFSYYTNFNNNCKQCSYLLDTNHFNNKYLLKIGDT